MDFSECTVIPKAYRGANGKKICVDMHNERYMLKFPPKAKRNESELEYTNSCFSEYISCHIYNALDIPVQETLLGTFRVAGKERIVVACKDFEVDGDRFQDFVSIKNSVLTGGQSGYATELSDLLQSMEEQFFVDPSVVKKRFWDMFIVDSYIGNFDRHNGNWGFLVNFNTFRSRLAPVFDCGSSLFPQASDRQMADFLQSEKEMEYRVFALPRSAIQMNGIKINPYEFLQQTTDPECMQSLIEIAPKIASRREKIEEIINHTEYISDVHKQFLRTILSKRFENILKPALQRALSTAE